MQPKIRTKALPSWSALLSLIMLGSVFAPTAVAQTGPTVSVGNLQLISSTRVGRTQFDYVYQADATYESDTPPLGDVQLALTSTASTTIVIDGTLSCGTLWGAQTAKNTTTCSDTFTIRQDRQASFTPSVLTWTVASATTLADEDGDGVPDGEDNCPQAPNSSQQDTDENGTGDACEVVISDQDGDNIPDEADNCPAVANSDQADRDNDGLGDACDDCLDVDQDQICDIDDPCPADPNNSCTFTIKGAVYGGGSALAGASIKIGNQTTESLAAPVGRFTIENVGAGQLLNDGASRFFPVEVLATGYSSGYAKVAVESGKTEYEVTVKLQPISATFSEDAGIAEGNSVAIVDAGKPVGQLTIPTDALPDGVTEIIGTVTYLDPTTDDLQSAPGGDLLALPAGADPNSTPVPLESYGMMEFDLRDQNGNSIHELKGGAEVCMKATPGLSEGNTIPLWWYDETVGLWKEEGQGTVRDVDGALMICGDVNHFTWWNYDAPITTHACFKFDFRDADTGTRLSGALEWYADGVTYSGASPARACNADSDDPSPPAPSKIDSFTVKRSASGSTEYIRVYTYVGGQTYYLMRDGDGSYSLTQNRDAATQFKVPEANASCLNDTNVDQCVFLDYADANPDGILPLSFNINYPPVISDFTVDQTLLTTGAVTSVSATVTDPEGQNPVTVSWETLCYANYWWWNEGYWIEPGTIDPTTSSGSSASRFEANFTAPSSLSSPSASCQITLKATDADGQIATAEQWVTVTGNSSLVLEGTLYGTDGQPMPNTWITHYQSDCNGYSHDSYTITDFAGQYRFDLATTGCEGEGYYGYLTIGYEYKGTSWTREETISPYAMGMPMAMTSDASTISVAMNGCMVQADSSLFCRHDVRLPTVWGPLSGTVYLSSQDAAINIGSSTYTSDVWDYSWQSLGSVSSDGTAYGPLWVPLSSSTSVDLYSLNSYLSYHAFQMPSTDGWIQDLGDATAPVTVTMFDGAGERMPNIPVRFISYSPYQEINYTTNSQGEFTVDASMGEFWVNAYTNGSYYGWGQGYVTLKDQPAYLDINGPETCTISGTAYDVTGQPLAAVQTLQGGSWNGLSYQDFATQTTENGQFTIENVRPGFIEFYSINAYGYSYWFRQPIDNCRPLNGQPRVIRMDLPYTELFQY